MRRERLRYLAVAVVPFVVTMAVITVLPASTGGRGLNGAAGARGFGLRYGIHTGTVALGIVLMTAPGLVAIFCAIGVAATLRNLIGGDAGRGGIEELLATPNTPAAIAATLLVIAIMIATVLWAAMSGLGALAVALSAAATGERITLTGSYLAVAVILPLLAGWAGAGLSLMMNLLFPRLAQLGRAGVTVNGGGLGSGLAILPAIGLMITLTGGAGIGPGEFLLIAGLATAAIAVFAVAVVAHRFRPEAVLDS
jgi:hypothetical protein